MNDNVIVLNESMLAIQKIYNPDEIKEVDNIGTEGLSVLFNNGNKIFIYFSNIKNNDVDLLKNYFVKFSNDFATA